MRRAIMKALAMFAKRLVWIPAPGSNALCALVRGVLLAGMAYLGAAHAAQADPAAYPTKPIRFLVPYAPGAGTDTTARVLAAKLAERWRQQVIVDNRSGGSGVVGVEAAVNANPDGHTIVLITNSQALGAASGLKLPYDLAKDLQPVTEVLSVFYVVYVPMSLPVKSTKELIAYAKANPDKLSYGSSGAGSLQHVGMELFNQTAGVKMLHVPYKGSAGIVAAMLANEIQVGMNSLFSVRPQVQAGRLRWLAMTAARRSPVVDIPTVAESGLPGFEMVQWYGIATPARVRKPVITELHAGFTDALKLPDVAQRLTADGSTLVGSTPDEFGERIRTDIAKWRKVVKAAGIRIE